MSDVEYTQAKVYCAVWGAKITFIQSAILFCSDDGCSPCLEYISMKFSTAEFSFVPLHVDIVEPDVLLIIALDILHKFKLVTGSVENKLKSKIYCWKMPNIRKEEHLFSVWNYAYLLFYKTRSEQVSSSRFHRSINKLFVLRKEQASFTTATIVGKFLKHFLKNRRTHRRFSKTDFISIRFS